MGRLRQFHLRKQVARKTQPIPESVELQPGYALLNGEYLVRPNNCVIGPLGHVLVKPMDRTIVTRKGKRDATVETSHRERTVKVQVGRFSPRERMILENLK